MLDRVNGQLQDISDERDLVVSMLTRMRILEYAAGRTGPAAQVLAELSRIPPAVVLSRVRIEGLELHVDGRRASARELAAMREQLQKSGLFTSVAAPEAQSDSNGVTGFSLSAALRPVRELWFEWSAKR